GERGALVPELVPGLMIDSGGPPQVVPRVRVVGGLHDQLEDTLGRFTVDLAHLAVHPRVMENTPRGVRDVTAPERITFRGGDPDHGQPRGDEAGAEQAVVVRGLVQVRTDLERENRPQVRRPRSSRTD